MTADTQGSLGYSPSADRGSLDDDANSREPDKQNRRPGWREHDDVLDQISAQSNSVSKSSAPIIPPIKNVMPK